MRRKNREINIFNISIMDVLASALGVFILIAVVLFPYYSMFKFFELPVV